MREVLKELVNINSNEDTIKLFNSNWKMRTLTYEERLDAVNVVEQKYSDDLAKLMALKKEFLSRSIIKINEVDVEQVEVLEILNNLPSSVIAALYEKYDNYFFLA